MNGRGGRRRGENDGGVAMTWRSIFCAHINSMNMAYLLAWSGLRFDLWYSRSSGNVGDL